MSTKNDYMGRIKCLIKESLIEIGRTVTQPRIEFVPDFECVVSFVHAYLDTEDVEPNRPMPTLWHINRKEKNVYSYPFPRTPNDFNDSRIPIIGNRPKKEIEPMAKLPRFGLTGLTKTETHIYAGSWNGIYKIRRDNFELDGIITHQLMNDMHGIHCDGQLLYSCLTSKDTLVISDISGKILETLTINRNLEVVQEPDLEKIDWRFISKQKRGSVGYFHFNFVQKFGDDIYLTSRNLSCFVILNLKTRKCHLRNMNFSVPNLIHDGIKVNDRFYFTSTDGKVFIAESAETNGNPYLSNRDLVVKYFRLKRMPNWCRGIEVKDKVILALVDGKYGSGLSFGVQAIDHDGKYLGEIRLRYQKTSFFKRIYYMTGFDVLVL